MKRILFSVGAICAAIIFMNHAHAQTQRVRVDISSNAPAGGVALTPVWVGFHDGSFDSYNGGISSQEGLERIAEDGNAGVLSSDFLSGFTYVDGMGNSNRVTTAQTSGRVDGVIGSPVPPLAPSPAPIQSGELVSQIFELDSSENQFFSYASMIIPSNDFFVANGNPAAFGLSALFSGSGSISFDIGTTGSVNDAGTEINDFDFSAANGLFGLMGGQSGPNMGADENGVVTNVIGDPFAGFLNTPAGDLSQLNFNDDSIYANGIATITITAVPEPTGLGILLAAGIGLFVRRRR